jgi:GNAT superfamily N-acetyltransferase
MPTSTRIRRAAPDIAGAVAHPTENSPMTVLLRPAAPADAAALGDLYLRSRGALAAYAPLAHAPAAVRDWLARVLIPSGGVTVAHDGDALVGMSAHTHDGPLTWLDQLYVCPTRLREGIGARLLAHVQALTPVALQLHTFQPNAAAIAFYERHGFVEIGRGDGSDNEERCPDLVYRWVAPPASGRAASGGADARPGGDRPGLSAAVAPDREI